MTFEQWWETIKNQIGNDRHRMFAIDIARMAWITGRKELVKENREATPSDGCGTLRHWSNPAG